MSVDSVDILSADEMREFWLSWNAGVIRFGRGNVICKRCTRHELIHLKRYPYTFFHKDFAYCSLALDENELVSLTDSEYTINALSVTSQLGQEALFEFPYNDIGTCAC